MSDIIDDPEAADISPKLKAMLRFLKKLTLAPDDVRPADAEELRAAGLDDEMIEDAVHVCAAFNAIVRLADSFEFEVGDDASFERGADMLLTRGYR